MDIVQKIKEDILNNCLPRGEPLRQVTLSERYRVSRIPIREALLLLKSEGWLVAHGKAGVMVPDLNWKEAEDLFLMRAELECLLLEMAFDSIQPIDIASARGILLELDKKELALARRGELNWCFHNTLYYPANRPTLHRVVENLNQQAVRYLGFSYGPLDHRETSQHEHEKLISLIESKQKQAALSYLKEHVICAGQLLVHHLKKNRSVD